MKSCFIVGAKILGIYLCYICLLNLFQTISALIAFQSSSSGQYLMLSLVSSAGSLIIILLFAGLLLFKTEQLSSVLKIGEDQGSPQIEVLVQPGIMLIGVYIFSSNIGRFLATLYFQLQQANAGRDPMGTMPNGPALSKDLLTVSITIVFSLLLIFGSAQIKKLITRPIQKRI